MLPPFLSAPNFCGLVVLMWLVVFPCSGQTAEQKSVFKRYSKSDKRILEEVTEHTSLELSKLNAVTRPIYQPAIKANQEYLKDRIKSKAFFNLDSAKNLIDSIAKRLIDSNKLDFDVPLIFVSHEPYMQARTFINGVFDISIGLLSMLENESQLAFVLSHEFVHRQNYHVANRIWSVHESELEATAKREFNKILNGRGTLEGLEDIQNKSYAVFRLSRSNEFEADSLGLEYIEKAGFDPDQVPALLASLGYRCVDGSVPSKDLLEQLFRETYPLRPYWLDSTLTIYNKNPSLLLIFDPDSVSTHPDLDLRLSKVSSRLNTGNKVKKLTLENMASRDFFIRTIDGAYTSKEFEVCLYMSLYLMWRDNRVQNDGFLVSTICKVFLDLYQAKYDHTIENNFLMYVNRYTIDYPAGLVQFNHFLHNLDRHELLEVAYHFLNKPSNFDPSLQEHYYLLFKIASLTERESVSQKVKDKYLEVFPLGYLRKDFK